MRLKHTKKITNLLHFFKSYMLYILPKYNVFLYFLIKIINKFLKFFNIILDYLFNIYYFC